MHKLISCSVAIALLVNCNYQTTNALPSSGIQMSFISPISAVDFQQIESKTSSQGGGQSWKQTPRPLTDITAHSHGTQIRCKDNNWSWVVFPTLQVVFLKVFFFFKETVFNCEIQMRRHNCNFEIHSLPSSKIQLWLSAKWRELYCLLMDNLRE